MGFLKLLFLCAAVAGSLSAGVDLRAQETGGGSALKENLDLPFDAVSRIGEEEEEAPEIVLLYGQAFEGDGFVFLGEGTT
jgi:hypothetical protein